MVARTVTGDEMRRSRSGGGGGGQQTAEHDDCAVLLVKTRDASEKKKKRCESIITAGGLFHTVTASTPRAKRMARVYPHSSVTGGLVVRQVAPFRANGVSQQQDQRYEQDAGDNGDHAGGVMAMWGTAAADSQRDSTGSYHFDDDSDCESESELCFTLTPTRVARQNSSNSSNAPTYQRRSSDYSENGSTARRGSQAAASAGNDRRATSSTTATGHVQEDILSRIATLKALCDQGFISSDEYERRKNAIVDELTFSFSQGDCDDDDESDFGDDNASELEVDNDTGAETALATRLAATQPNSRRSLGRSTEGLPLIVPHGPNFHDIRSEIATKHVFDYATRQWSSSQVQIALDETPFSKGSLRVVYHLLDLTSDDEERKMSGRRRESRVPKRKNYVAKLAIDPDEDPQTYFRDTELQAHCAHYAQMYNSYNPPKRVEFIEAWVLELTER